MAVNPVEELTACITSADPNRHILQACVGGQLRMGQLRGVYWRVMLGVLSPPPPNCQKQKSPKKDEDGSSTADDEDDPLYDLWSKEVDNARKVFADWLPDKELPVADRGKKKEASQSTAVAGGEEQKNEASKKKKKPTSGPRFGDESTSSSDDEDETVAVAAMQEVPTARGVIDNPLATDGNSAWALTFERAKVMQLVDKDLERLWGGDDYFDDDDVRGAMREVLECLLDANVISDYCQGMHELLSMMVLVLQKDADTVAASVKPGHPFYYTLRAVCSPNYIRHDAAAMLSVILRSVNGLGIAAWYDADPEENLSKKTVVKLSEKLQAEMLAKVDQELSRHLEKLEVQAVVYLLRWLRLLFLREFPFHQTAQIWDIVFAEYSVMKLNCDDSLIPYIALSMLLFIKNHLMERDYAMALRRLMKYPPIEDPRGILVRAVEMAYKPGSVFGKICGLMVEPVPATSSNSFDIVPEVVTAAAQPRHVDAYGATKRQSPVGAVKLSASNSQVRLSPLPSSPHAPPPLFEQASSGTEALVAKEKRLGGRLDKLINVMHSKWFPSQVAPGTDDVDDTTYIVAIAELKQIRDILLGDLPEQ